MDSCDSTGQSIICGGMCYKEAVSYTHLDVYKRQDCVTVMITNILCEDEERDFDKISASEVEKLESEVIKELSNLVKAIRDEDKTCLLYTSRCV